MPRPQKKRFVCRLPQTEKFFPSKITNTDYVKILLISGGDYITCSRYNKQCKTGCKKYCHKHQCSKKALEDK